MFIFQKMQSVQNWVHSWDLFQIEHHEMGSIYKVKHNDHLFDELAFSTKGMYDLKSHYPFFCGMVRSSNGGLQWFQS